MPGQNESPRRYIIMYTGFMSAANKLQPPNLSDSEFSIASAAVPLSVRHAAINLSPTMTVIDAVDRDGPRLVEMPAEGELSLRLKHPGIDIFPEVFYELQRIQYRAINVPHPQRRSLAKMDAGAIAALAADVAAGTKIKLSDSQTGKGLAGATIILFTNFAAPSGFNVTSDGNGEATVKDLPSNRKLERVYIYPPAGYWGAYLTDTSGAKLSDIKLAKVDPGDPTLLLNDLYGSLPGNTGEGVTIGIIDTGVDAHHPDLPNVVGGLNCVGSEVRVNAGAAQNYGPAAVDGDHGTHVAGIAAGRGLTSGFRGIAPGAKIRSYRVFPDAGGGASNFDIIKAIATAVTDRCDIIEMRQRESRSIARSPQV